MLLKRIKKNYQFHDLQIQKKVETLFYVNLFTVITALFLSYIMVTTHAYNVVIFCMSMLLVNVIIYLLLYYKKHKIASHILIIALYVVMFSAIKFDAYVDIYETYVLSTLGLVLLIIASLISFSKWQIIAVTVAVILGIFGLWWVDIFPSLNYNMDILQIQNLATSLIMVFLGSAAGISLVKIQENLLFSTKADRDRIKKMLSMTEIYTKKSLVSIIAEGKDPTKFIPVTLNRVILFCDIREFTSLSESMNPIDIVGFLNSFFSRMNKEIHKCGGEIDKLIGDCIMASFDNKEQALKCSVAMCQHLQNYNTERIGYGLKAIYAGIGISYGSVVVGNIGSESKMDFTSIGDVVNCSSRIESLTKVYGLDILTSMPPKSSNPINEDTRFIDKIVVKGKKEPICIYEIFSHEPKEIKDFKINNREEFFNAYTLYKEGKFSEAEDCYTKLISKAGNHKHKEGLSMDPALDFYRDRCRVLKNSPLHTLNSEWDGIFVFNS